MDERNPCTTYTWFSYSPIQNTWRIFGSVIVFLEVRGHFIPGEKCIIYVGPRWRNGGWRNWRRKWMDFSVFLIVVHRFYILHSTFCILYFAFYILYSSFMHFIFYILYSVSYIWHSVSDILYNIFYIMYCIVFWIFKVRLFRKFWKIRIFRVWIFWIVRKF